MMAELVREIASLSRHHWVFHASGPRGDAALPLVSVGGGVNLDFPLYGPVGITPALGLLPLLLPFIEQAPTPISRCRVVRVPPGDRFEPRAELSAHFLRHQTLVFSLGEKGCGQLQVEDRPLVLHPGEPCLLDCRRPHTFLNLGEEPTYFLLVEIRQGAAQPLLETSTFADRLDPRCFEVLDPEEAAQLLSPLLEAGHADTTDTTLKVQAALEHFLVGWKTAYARYGSRLEGELTYRSLLRDGLERGVGPLLAELPLARAREALPGFRTLCTSLDPVADQLTPVQARERQVQKLLRVRRIPGDVPGRRVAEPEFDRPLFIVSAPRAGSTLLFECLSALDNVWTTGQESHALLEAIPSLHPASKGWHSNRLEAEDATPDVCTVLRSRMAQALLNSSGKSWAELPDSLRPHSIRFLEKTPKNALRIPFLRQVFPGARFLVLYRSPLANLSSMLEGWRAQRFQAYRELPDWPYGPWSFLLTPGWQEWKGLRLAELVSRQWRMTVETLLDDVEQLPSADWTLVRYETLVQSPVDTLQRITRFAKLELDSSLRTKLNDVLPISSMTLSEPATEKWRRSAWELDQVRALWMPVEARLERLLEQLGSDVARPELPPAHPSNRNPAGMADGGARPSPW